MINLIPQTHARKMMDLAVQHFHDWPIKSAEAFRNAMIGCGESAFAINPLLEIDQDQDIEMLLNLVKTTVSEGRMIDFGFIPNEILKSESVRNRAMFEAGEFTHPFNRWLGITTWEGGFNGYHVSSNPIREQEILVLELYGIAIPDIADMVMLYDVISIELNGVGKTLVHPANMRVDHLCTIEEMAKRGANSLDPLVTMLRLLADASIPVRHHPAPDRLNKHRLLKGEPPIPAHNVVLTRDYVSSFHAAHARGASKGGTHASPIAHWRRAHQRILSDGRVVPVRSSKVNWRDMEELHRMFYRQKGTK